MPHGLWKIPIISSFCSFPSQRLHLLQWNLICRLIIYEYIGQVKFWVRSSYFWQSYAPWTLKNSDYLQFPFIFFSEVFKGGGIKCFTNISRLNLISNSLIILWIWFSNNLYSWYICFDSAFILAHHCREASCWCTICWYKAFNWLNSYKKNQNKHICWINC